MNRTIPHNRSRRYARLFGFLGGGFPLVAHVCAQQAPTPSRATTPSADVVELSPFEVRASTDVGYQATETLAGSRLNSALKDVATQLQVMTPEFLRDLGITSLDDAMRYSLNTETTDENINVETQNNSALGSTITPDNSQSRTRNLGRSNTTHDFFDTVVPVDSYNTERFTFSSGPNSILFGNSGPAGTIDTSLKRASTTKRRYEVDFRTDNYGSVRTVADLNQPILKNQLGLRLVNLRDRQKNWREPAYSNQDRYFASVVVTPVKRVSARGYYERSFMRAQTAINTMAQDHITPWLAAGKPIYNNGGTTFVVPPPITAVNDPNHIFGRDNTGGPTRPFAMFDLKGPVGAFAAQANTVYVRGYDELPLNAEDRFERSILDGRIYPFDVSLAGNGNGNKSQSWIRGLIVEFNPLKNLYFEAGVNQEQLRQRGVSMFRGTDTDVRVDANQFLDFGGNVLRNVPNPNLGRYYLQTNADAAADARKNYFERDQRRLSAAYELDFTKRTSWTKWLGRHRVAGLYERLQTQVVRQAADLRVVSDHSFITTGTALNNLNAGPRNGPET